MLIVDIDVHHPVVAVQDATQANLTVPAIGSEPNRERAAAAIATGAVGWWTV